MASPEVIDVGALLAPIEGDSPCGEDLRSDLSPSCPYFIMKSARNDARRAERDAFQDPEGTNEGGADWRPILDMAPKALRERSKDLEIATWYVEALVRRHGIPGLRDGMRLVQGLVEQYWEGAYPRPEPDDDDDIDVRVAAFAGLNGLDAEGTLISPIAQIPITEGSSVGPFGSWQYTQALELEKLEDPDKIQRRLNSGAVSREMFETAVRETSPDFLRGLVEDISAAQEAYAAVTALLDGHCGSSSPPTSQLRGALEGLLRTLKYVAPEALPSENEPAADEPTEGSDGASSGGAPAQPAAPAGALQTRDDALRALTKVAEYFRSSEPHSPISYALEQAVRWGRMPLPELLQELIRDDSVRAEYFRVAGISRSSDD